MIRPPPRPTPFPPPTLSRPAQHAYPPQAAQEQVVTAVFEALVGDDLAQAGHRVYGGLALVRSEEHTSELQSLAYIVCRLLLEKKKTTRKNSRPDSLAPNRTT